MLESAGFRTNYHYFPIHEDTRWINLNYIWKPASLDFHFLSWSTHILSSTSKHTIKFKIGFFKFIHGYIASWVLLVSIMSPWSSFWGDQASFALTLCTCMFIYLSPIYFHFVPSSVILCQLFIPICFRFCATSSILALCGLFLFFYYSVSLPVLFLYLLHFPLLACVLNILFYKFSYILSRLDYLSLSLLTG